MVLGMYVLTIQWYCILILPTLNESIITIVILIIFSITKRTYFHTESQPAVLHTTYMEPSHFKVTQTLQVESNPQASPALAYTPVALTIRQQRHSAPDHSTSQIWQQKDYQSNSSPGSSKSLVLNDLLSFTGKELKRYRKDTGSATKY